MDEILTFIYDNILSIVMMVLLISAGLFLSCKLRFLQFRRFGFAMKNTIVGTSVTSKTLDRSDYNVLAINTSDCTLTLPTMQLYDDGHVIRIKRLGSGGLKIKLGYCYTWNGTSSRYTRPILIYNQNDKLTGTNTLNFSSVCDAFELVWCRDIQYTIDNTTYYGAWIQYKLPRDW